MKTSTTDVQCDHCLQVIPKMSEIALFVTIRGINIRFKKLDFCDVKCLRHYVQNEGERLGLEARTLD